MSDALKRLIDAVEQGTTTEFQFITWRPGLSGTRKESLLMMRAYDGKLDAAKALHDALLPGWNYLVSANDGEVWHDGIYHESTIAHVHGNPARAWLLAILRAYQQVQA